MRSRSGKPPSGDVHMAHPICRRCFPRPILTVISDAQKAWQYAHCWVFLLSSLTEGFGRPPIKELCRCKPV